MYLGKPIFFVLFIIVEHAYRKTFHYYIVVSFSNGHSTYSTSDQEKEHYQGKKGARKKPRRAAVLIFL